MKLPQSHPLKLRTIVRGDGGPRFAVNDIIDEHEELEEYAQSCADERARAAILNIKPKFEREKVIAVALGERPTAGFEVEIVSATQVSGGSAGLQTVIWYVERSPSGPAADVLTYPHHAVRIKNAAGAIVFRRVPDATTLAVGEEGGPTTLAVGEEGGPTTLAVGEENPTTLAVGEEDQPTTKAIGEEGMATTLAVGEEGGTTTHWGPWEETLTTLAVGEEGSRDPRGSGGAGGQGPFGGF